MDGPRSGFAGRMGGHGESFGVGTGARGTEAGPTSGGPALPRSFGRMGTGNAGPPRGNGFGPGGGLGGFRGGMGAGPPVIEPPFTVDRERTCPLLLRVWTKNGGHHRLEDFAVRGKEPPGDIHVYTWMDATLRELSDLIKEVIPDARRRGSRLSFASIYPDRQGRNVMKQLGLVHCTRTSEDDERTLKSLKFQTGDFLDVAVLAGF